MKKPLIDQWINFPFIPSRIPVFYGWIIILLGIIGMLMSIPGQTMGVSVFTDHLLEDYFISRSDISLAYLIGTILSGSLITFAGIFYDRYGARILAMFASFMLGISLVYLTKIDSLSAWINNSLHLSEKIITLILLTLGFFGIRFFGQGVLTMVSRNMVMKWFSKRRGLANSYLSSFVTFGFSIAPFLLFSLVENFGWRGAWINLGIIIGFTFALFAFLFFRDNPIQCNLIPDGKLSKRISNKIPPSLPPKDYRLKDAIRTYTFWIYNVTMVMHGLFITALTFQVKSIFENAGLNEHIAFIFFIPVAIVSVITNFAGSWSSDFIRLKILLLFYLLALILSMTVLQFLGTSQIILWLLIIGTGIASGMYGIMASVVWPRFFGVKYLGEISGFSLSCIVVGTALGPYLFAISLQHTGSYNPAIFLCLVITGILFILAFWANNVNIKKSANSI
ncbi:MAG: MFS transporter [Bacteroidales bacterium]|nr:MFS transporter [Bacteroidales bacterium]